MSFDRENTIYKGTNEGRVVPEFADNLKYMEASANFSVLDVSFINVAKYIRTAEMRDGTLEGTSQWTNLGMKFL